MEKEDYGNNGFTLSYHACVSVTWAKEISLGDRKYIKITLLGGK